MLGDELTFESLKLLPGTRFDVKSDKHSYIKGVSEFVGYYNKQTIIISTPISEGVSVACKVGNEIILRFFVNHLNCVCAFRCDIVHVAAVPFSHIYVSVPDTMEIGEVRKSVRANVDLECLVHRLETDKKTEGCKIQNLSVDGAKMESDTMVAKEGDDIVVKIVVNVLDIEKSLKIKAKVRSVKLESGHRYSYGLQFFEESYGKRLLIYAYVLSHITG